MSSNDVFLCGTPGNLMAISQNEAVLLKWDKIDEADGYRVYMYDSINNLYNPIKYSTAPEKVIFSLNNNIEYRFKVRAYRLINGKEVYTDFSEEAAGTPLARGFETKESFLMLHKFQTYDMNCTYDGYPTDSVNYISSDEKIVTVDCLGTITAISSGEAIVTASSTICNQFAKLKVVVDRVALSPAISIFEPRFIRKEGIFVNPASSKSMFASIAITGDMMCISNQQKKALLNNGTYNFTKSFELIRPAIMDEDFAIGTLETMLSASHPYSMDKMKVEGKPNCNAPSNFLDGIRYAGFDAVITATNHSCDTELNGIEETLSHIKQYNLINLGINERFFIIEINGIKVAFFAYTMVSNNRDDFLDEEQKESILCKYSKDTFEYDYKVAQGKGAEFSIVMMHWGIMNSTMVRGRQTSAAKEMAAVGADYIIGSHPHVLQKADIITTTEKKKVPVIYSLGNFISSMREMSEGTNTIILRLKLEKTLEGIFCSSEYVPCVILHKYKEASYVTVPVIEEFCGYEGTSRTEMLQRIRDIQGIIGNKIKIVEIKDPVFDKLTMLAPEALSDNVNSLDGILSKVPNSADFKAEGYSLGRVVVLIWDIVDGADGYRIYKKNTNNIFSGLANSDTDFISIMNIEMGKIHEFKIKAFKRQKGQLEFFASSEIVRIYMPFCPALPALISEIGNGIQINWIQDNQAQGYRLYQENAEGIFNGVVDMSGGEFVMETFGDVRFKIKPYTIMKSKRIYFNSSHILRKNQRLELPLISFVIPEYNDEEYLERLFNSILSNTVINCEVIVVNDGATDGSQKIIDEYCKNFPLIFQSIIQENSGVSAARNAGIAVSRGRYIGFIDSDDCIRPETCELLEKAIQTDADIIIAAYYKHKKQGEIGIQGKLPFEEYVRHEIDYYLSLLYGKGYAGQAAIWNKLYRAELIKNRPIPSMKTEDVAWTPYIASYAKSFAYVATPLYEYLRREGSTSDIINKNTNLEVFERRMKSIDFFLENGNPLQMGRLHDIAEKRLEWHINNTKENSLYIDELMRLKAKRCD